MNGRADGDRVTAACAALWMSVVVVDGSCVIIVCEPAPTAGGFGYAVTGARAGLPVNAGPLQRSCQFSSAESESACPGRPKSAAFTV